MYAYTVCSVCYLLLVFRDCLTVVGGLCSLAIPACPLSGNSLGQAAQMHVPLSPSSIIWYQSMGGDALRLGR